MEIGDILHRQPEIYSASGLEAPGVMPCTVIWVHPAKRFFVVEFRSAVTGETWRETVYFPLTPNEPKQRYPGFHQRPGK